MGIVHKSSGKYWLALAKNNEKFNTTPTGVYTDFKP